jgi:hypothetical protein
LLPPPPLPLPLPMLLLSLPLLMLGVLAVLVLETALLSLICFLNKRLLKIPMLISIKK